ncbi:VOC family protein [Dankookia sp. GCM10030260]|uniref:VOC family protein n=1 Tax=Dankookia sp. GCM10030260 TaxID=3273390 RepID=UPI00361A2B43
MILFDPPAEVAHGHAISLFLTCATQAEVDALWDGLLEGGKPVQCGWLTDRYGVSWQVVPSPVGDLLQEADADQAGRVKQAIEGMVKIDLATLEAAFRG